MLVIMEVHSLDIFARIFGLTVKGQRILNSLTDDEKISLLRYFEEYGQTWSVKEVADIIEALYTSGLSKRLCIEEH